MFDVMQSTATNGGIYPPVGGSTTTSSMASNGNSSGNSRAREIGLRAQKKLLGRFAASNAGRSMLIDDATASILDNLYKLMERAARNSQQLDKKQPEKVLKNIVKLSIKIGLLQRNQQLGASDFAQMEQVRRSLRSTAMAVMSFYELDFSFDRGYLVKSLEKCRVAVHELIRPHLTDKSHERCDQVFDFLCHQDFLDAVFAQHGDFRPTLGALVQDLNRALENGHL